MVCEVSISLASVRRFVWYGAPRSLGSTSSPPRLSIISTSELSAETRGTVVRRAPRSERAGLVAFRLARGGSRWRFNPARRAVVSIGERVADRWAARGLRAGSARALALVADPRRGHDGWPAVEISIPNRCDTVHCWVRLAGLLSGRRPEPFAWQHRGSLGARLSLPMRAQRAGPRIAAVEVPAYRTPPSLRPGAELELEGRDGLPAPGTTLSNPAISRRQAVSPLPRDSGFCRAIGQSTIPTPVPRCLVREL
jgi:hypothetical protein